MLLLDPDTMDFESRIDFHGGSFSGFDAMAYLGSRKDFLATRGSGVFQVDKNGRFLQSFNTSLGQLKGAVVVGDTLYLADGQGSSIVAATVPAPPSTVSTSPKGMATDGEKLYLVVDGSPKDRVLVLSAGTGQVLNSYEAPGDNVDGLAWHNGDVYVVTNEYHPFKGNLPPRIYRLTSSSGAVLQEYEIQAPWGGVVEEPISGLASDGTYLYAGRRDGPQWFRLDPASPGLPADEISAQGDFMWTDYVGSLETAAAPGIPTTLLSSGWSVAGQVITRYEPDSGVVTDQFNIGNRSIEGMAYIGTVLYLADANSDTVLTATIPDNIPEITTAGDYTAALKVVSGQIASTSEPPAPISLVRNTNMQSEITAPLANFATTSSVIPIHGRVSDPSVTSVTVGVVLPFTTLLEDAVTQGASPALWDADGLWNVDCSAFWPMPMNSSEPCAWRYGVTDLPGYGQNAISKGSLTTKDPITVGPKTKLSFSTWYATEPAADVDLKLVEVAVVSTDADGNDVIGDYEALIQIVGHGFFGAPLPVDDQDVPLFRAHSSFEHREVEQELVDFDAGNQPSPRFETIVKSLHPFIGDRIMLRFRFDTVDDFANDALGWFIDDITVEGSGFKGQQTAVTPLEPPLTVGNVTWYGMFDTTFTLAEGLNRVVVAAEQPYPPKPHGPNLVGLDFVNGYLDLTGPAVTLGGIDEIVAVPSQTLEGTIDDINFTSMAITHTYLAGNGIQEKTVYAITEFPGDGTFSAPVSLLEGTNTFKATALDGSLNKSEVTFAVDLDTVAPALTPLSTSYPVGAASARAGDLVVFQASSTDALGVDRVSITLPDGSVKDMVPSDQVPEAVLDQWRTAAPWVLPMEIPSATPPGAFELTVTAIDNAGNQASASVVASVVPALEAFTFNLLPGQNLISLPLKPDTTTITDLLGAELLSAIDTIMYYDASLAGLPQEDRWLMFSPDAPSNLQTLTELRTGRGFWVRMKDDAFSFSAPLAPGLPSTPRPILFTYFGRFLEPGTVPPTYPVVPGWNLIGFHSEHPLPVTTALQSLESPQRIWASLFQYDNVIRFELDEEPEIILGGFSRVLPTGVMEPGAGFWMFMVDGGVIVP